MESWEHPCTSVGSWCKLTHFPVSKKVSFPQRSIKIEYCSSIKRIQNVKDFYRKLWKNHYLNRISYRANNTIRNNKLGGVQSINWNGNFSSMTLKMFFFREHLVPQLIVRNQNNVIISAVWSPFIEEKHDLIEPLQVRLKIPDSTTKTYHLSYS